MRRDLYVWAPVRTFLQLAVEIGNRAPRCGPVRLVAIDGPGGAGKSVFAARLARAVADRQEVTVLHTDDFASWQTPVDWWPRLEQQVLACLRHGRRGCFQRYDWTTGQRAEWVAVPLTPVVLLEGVSSARAAVTAELSYTVWIETPRVARLQRGLARDGEHACGQWQEWMAAEDHHFHTDATRRRADLLVDGNPRPPPADPERCYVPATR